MWEQATITTLIGLKPEDLNHKSNSKQESQSLDQLQQGLRLKKVNHLKIPKSK